MNIAHISYDLSGDAVPLSELEKLAEIPLSERYVFEKIFGLKFVIRNLLLTHEKQLINLLSQFFKKNKVDKNKIQYCFYAHTADDIAPSGFQIFENSLKKHGLVKTQFFGVSLHKCASVFQLFKLSSQLFENLSDEDTILLLVSDLAFTDILQYIPGSTVLSDSALLIQLKKSVLHRFVIDTILNEQGSFSRGIFGDHEEQLLFQSSYLDNVVNTIQKLLHKNNMIISQIKKIFPHNVNVFSWKKVAEKLQISLDRFYLNNISKIAHCFGADPFINFFDAESEGILVSGDYIILVTVGLGSTFAAMLVKY
ncbi:MAG: 3-oxoacyl-[acyl-carrier-protein] synthase III C-terminal domain-containing protein [Coxiellaceae bacterium]|nr:3-oxoacyl-[acyl-carrier-protein] synthase III C-terminal domain-containing protein [Coxiellaceae bacterium]